MIAVADEIRTVLLTLNLRVPAWGVQKVSPPAALVDLPERIDYDQTYGRGCDRIRDWRIFVLVGKPEPRASQAALMAYASGTGAKSVQAAFTAHTWVACSDAHVVWAEPDVMKFAGVDYLTVVFHVDVIGKGV